MKTNWDVSIRLKQIVIKIVMVEKDFDYKIMIENITMITVVY